MKQVIHATRKLHAKSRGCVFTQRFVEMLSLLSPVDMSVNPSLIPTFPQGVTQRTPTMSGEVWANPEQGLLTLP